jgi:acetolactate decarboxylase
MDGQSYKSTVVNDSSMKVDQTFDLKAPFFGYAYIPKWKEFALPDVIRTIPELERHLDSLTLSSERPVLFRLSGVLDRAKIHVVNLPAGSKVASPAVAHVGQRDYALENTSFEVLGFFSTKHKAIFTHHDTYLHMHLITSDGLKMGHLDAISLRAGAVKLFLPAE